MGQYYQIINLTNKLFINPDGIKLMEHSWVGNNSMDNVCAKIEKGADWFQSKLIWAGDYSDDESKKPIHLTEKQIELYKSLQNPDSQYPEITPYDLCVDNYRGKEITPEMEVQFFSQTKVDSELSFDYKDKYLINYDKEEYLDFNKLPDTKMNWHKEGDECWKVHPLSLLMCISNNRGGGDYRASAGEEYIGTWAGDRVGIDIKILEVFKEINPDFKE